MLDIIIPAYNAENKIHKVLSSLTIQTINDFNVYIIDDGSNDCICNEISKFNSYLNIKYLKCPHIGKPGLVRNYGLENSNGDYIMFCDSDDFFAPNAVEIVSKTFNDFPEIDFIIGFFYEQLQNGNFIQKTQSASTWLHGNAYKREFLNKYNIRFPEQKLNEDGAFNTQVYLSSDNYKIINLPIYYWMYDSSSLTRNNKNKNDFDFESFIDLVDSLHSAYIQLFKNFGYTENIINNMGSHLAIFYFKLCDLVHYYTLNNKYKKQYSRAVNSLNAFFNDLDKSIIFNSESFKSGFCSHYLNRKTSNTLLSLDSYFSIFGFINFIKPEDFCGISS